MKAHHSLINQFSYKQKALLIIVLFTLARAVVAFTMELGGDEAYYWFYSLDLKSNYFDHPPMIAYWIRFFTFNLHLQYIEGFVRLGSVLGCALSSYFMFQTCSLLHSDKAGFFGVCLYNISFYAGVTAGLLAMPDAPQMVFFTLSLLLIVRITKDESNWKWWILFGIATGFCIMSKIHGVFIWFGLGLYVLSLKRSWLITPQLYVALLIALIITCPILLYNLRFNFATYSFHSSRVSINNTGINVVSFFKEVASHFFFNNPFSIIIIATAFIAYTKAKIIHNDALTLFNFISIPLAAILLIISLFRDATLPHWNGPAYVALIPLAAVYLASVQKIVFPKLITAGIIGFFAFILSWQLVNYFYPGTYGSQQSLTLGKGDVTLDKIGRRKAGKQFAALYQEEVSKGIMPQHSPVVYYKWWVAHIEYYFCSPYNIPVIGLGNITNLHEYLWMNEKRISKVNMTKAYCITPSDDRDDMMAHYLPYYSNIDLITIIRSYRGNKPSSNFYIYRLSGFKNNLPTASQFFKHH